MHLKLFFVFLTFITVSNAVLEILEDEALKLAYHFALRSYRVPPGKGLSLVNMSNFVGASHVGILLRNMSPIMVASPTLDQDNIEFELFERLVRLCSLTERVVSQINSLYKDNKPAMDQLRELLRM